jgi:hypothetical protein
MAVRLLAAGLGACNLSPDSSPRNSRGALVVRMLPEELSARTFRSRAPQRIPPLYSSARRLSEEFARRAIPSPGELFFLPEKSSTQERNSSGARKTLP